MNSIVSFDSLGGFLWVFHLLAYFCFFFEFRMGPIRGFKRKKKAEKKVDQNVFAAASLSSQPQPLDWWDEFSQRITGTNYFLSFFCFSSNSASSLLLVNFILSVALLLNLCIVIALCFFLFTGSLD